MDFYEKEQKFEVLRRQIKQRKKVIENVRVVTTIVAILFVMLLSIVFYTNAIIDTENELTKISKIALFILFTFLVLLRFLLKRHKHQMMVMDGKINVLINIG